MDAIVPSTSSLVGTGATVITTTVTEGADEMGGDFLLSFGGERTEKLLYTADETSVEAVLEVKQPGKTKKGIKFSIQAEKRNMFKLHGISAAHSK